MCMSMRGFWASEDMSPIRRTAPAIMHTSVELPQPAVSWSDAHEDETSFVAGWRLVDAVVVRDSDALRTCDPEPVTIAGPPAAPGRMRVREPAGPRHGSVTTARSLAALSPSHVAFMPVSILFWNADPDPGCADFRISMLLPSQDCWSWKYPIDLHAVRKNLIVKGSRLSKELVEIVSDYCAIITPRRRLSTHNFSWFIRYLDGIPTALNELCNSASRSILKSADSHLH